MKVLQYGMVGGGIDSLIGSSHRQAIGLDNSAILCAGCFSRNLDKNLKMGRNLGIEEGRIYRDYIDMAKSEKGKNNGIDFVVIATPNDSHYEIAKTFIEAGIPVVCDKPLTVSVEQAEKLKALVNKKNIPFMVTYTYSGYVAVKQIRYMIEQGLIGNIRTIVAEYAQEWLAGADISGNKQALWRTDPKQAGMSNTLSDIGTHIENTVYRITGLHIEKVLARMECIVPGRVLDDNSVVLATYDNGASGIYWASQIAIGHDNSLRIRIYGDKGSLHWFQEDCEKVLYFKEDGSRLEIHKGDAVLADDLSVYQRLPAGHNEGWIGALANHYKNFIQCLRVWQEGKDYSKMVDFPTIDDGFLGMKFIEACVKSEKMGNVWVDVNSGRF